MTNTVFRGESRDGHAMRVAVADIYDELLLERIRAESGCRIIPVQRTEDEIRRMLRADAQRSSEALLRELESGKKRDASSDSMPVISLVDSILESALEQGATDIHFEPDSQSFKVRFRKDGLLHDYRALPAWIAEPILIRLKLLAQADITERRLPHDGSFTFQGAHTQANVRLSTLPVQYGEKCVLRLLPANDDAQTLDDLEFSPAIRQAFRNAFSAPQGLFLITGPTGSGKTTTLYAGLREIIHRDINVTTIEDPVEYTLHGANQVQVNEKCGFTFATALRSVLRQDPDVILIGEIRDSETAQIALRAAQTGHLVLATLHTNSARAAETRLQDLGIAPKLFRESLIGIVAQRLLRKRDPQSEGYKGRIAAVEFLRPDGTYVDGDLKENALRLVREGVTDMGEIARVFGL